MTTLTDANIRRYDAGGGNNDPNSFEYCDPEFTRKMEQRARDLEQVLGALIKTCDKWSEFITLTPEHVLEKARAKLNEDLLCPATGEELPPASYAEIGALTEQLAVANARIQQLQARFEFEFKCKEAACDSEMAAVQRAVRAEKAHEELLTQAVSLSEAARRPKGSVSLIHQYDAEACCKRMDELAGQLEVEIKRGQDWCTESIAHRKRADDAEARLEAASKEAQEATASLRERFAEVQADAERFAILSGLVDVDVETDDGERETTPRWWVSAHGDYSTAVGAGASLREAVDDYKKALDEEQAAGRP